MTLLDLPQITIFNNNNNYYNIYYYQIINEYSIIRTKLLNIAKYFNFLKYSQGPIYDWVLSHRIHHKFYGTENDPYNHSKGFLYSHVFSTLMTDTPDRKKVEKDIDMRIIEVDGYVWLQRR